MCKVIATLAVALILSGCSGTLRTYTNPTTICPESSTNCHFEGVLYRPLIKSEKHYVRDRILDLKGNVTHHLTGEDGKRCTPIEVTEIILIPDPNNEYLISYDAAFFETAKFSVDLNPNGTLSKVGMESTPGGKSLAESLVTLATTAKALSHGEVAPAFDATDTDTSSDPFCSHGELAFPNG